MSGFGVGSKGGTRRRKVTYAVSNGMGVGNVALLWPPQGSLGVCLLLLLEILTVPGNGVVCFRGSTTQGFFLKTNPGGEGVLVIWGPFLDPGTGGHLIDVQSNTQRVIIFVFL